MFPGLGRVSSVLQGVQRGLKIQGVPRWFEDMSEISGALQGPRRFRGNSKAFQEASWDF